MTPNYMVRGYFYKYITKHRIVLNFFVDFHSESKTREDDCCLKKVCRNILFRYVQRRKPQTLLETSRFSIFQGRSIAVSVCIIPKGWQVARWTDGRGYVEADIETCLGIEMFLGHYLEQLIRSFIKLGIFNNLEYLIHFFFYSVFGFL